MKFEQGNCQHAKWGDRSWTGQLRARKRRGEHEMLHPSEIQEVSSILGQSLIDKNKELHDEIKSLLMILEEYVQEVDQREKQRNWNVQLGRDSNKDFLASEIRDFISALSEKLAQR
eukprot:263167-Hanusia_phi.AAC.3